MSVIGLMVSLTQRLTRSRSFHAVCVITISRGCVAPPRQSPGLSAQNSTQPIGERVISPRLAYRTRSSPACAVAVIAHRTAAKASPIPAPLMPIVAPVSCWDHTSHKGFAPPLSCARSIELNTAQSFGYLNLYLNRIRLKFETTAIDSNFMHLGASPMKARTSQSETGRARCDSGMLE